MLSLTTMLVKLLTVGLADFLVKGVLPAAFIFVLFFKLTY